MHRVVRIDRGEGDRLRAVFLGDVNFKEAKS